MHKKKFFILNIIFFLSLIPIVAGCESEDFLIQKERKVTLHQVKRALEVGISNPNLSVRKTREKGFLFIKDYVFDNFSPLIIINWEKENKNEQEKLQRETNFFNIELIFNNETIKVKAKVTDVLDELDCRIIELRKKLQYGNRVDGIDLDTWDTWDRAFEEVIKKNEHLSNPEFEFELELNPDFKNKTLRQNENTIPIIIKIKDPKGEQEYLTKIFQVNLWRVSKSNGDKVFEQIRSLNFKGQNLTDRHKKEVALNFINDKISELPDHYDISATEIIADSIFNTSSFYKNEYETLIRLRLEDKNGRSRMYDVLLENIVTFYPDLGYTNLINIVKNQDIVFEFKKGSKSSDLQKTIEDHSLLNQHYLFSKKFYVKILNESQIKTETITELGETREIEIRFKIGGTESQKVKIKYIVKDNLT